MSTEPWSGDACSLVDAFRAGTISPTEALEGSLEAIGRSTLNAVCHLDEEQARAAAARADVTLPFGGVPVGIKELDSVRGWPHSEGSLVFRDRVAETDTVLVSRLREAGVVPVAQTTASEFGGINVTATRLHGVTGNPWRPDRTPGGSSGGSAAAVAGGLVPIATGSDGGGSIRIPAGFTGLFGLKATFGRIPKGPPVEFEPLTAVFGCLSRSVRDTARWFDACNGPDGRDPFSLPKVSGWEEGLGTRDLSGLRAVVAPDLGSAYVATAVADLVEEAAADLVARAGLVRRDVPVAIPRGGVEWAMAGTVSLLASLGDRYPDCEQDLTPEMMLACNITSKHFDTTAAIAVESFRRRCIAAMAAVFDEVDVVLCATNPDVAFPAAGPMPTTVDGVDLIAEHGFEAAVGNNGALTIPANTTGHPAASIPAGTVEGLPVGLQVIARHHAEPLLLELGLVAERTRPWPLVAPDAPC